LSTFVDLSADEDSDYSVGDISVITECESVQIGGPEDANDDEVNAEEEVDVFQLGTGDQGVGEDIGISIVEHSSTDIPDDILMQLFEEVDNQQCLEVDPAPTLANVRENVEMELEVPAESETNVNTDVYGYVLAIDNLDMNVRRSFQRVDRTTQSMHLCHAFAALNRIDTSGLEDGSISGILSPAAVFPNEQDLQILIDDFKVLISRLAQVINICVNIPLTTTECLLDTIQILVDIKCLSIGILTANIVMKRQRNLWWYA